MFNSPFHCYPFWKTFSSFDGKKFPVLENSNRLQRYK